MREVGDPSGEADALLGLGEALLDADQPEQARTQHTAALALAVEIEDRYEQARSHVGLAAIHHAVDEYDLAECHWNQALALYASLDVPEADDVRTILIGRMR